MAPHHLYLIPGFFGFANFGELKYFAHVRDALDQRFAEAGADVRIHYVPTLPTALLSRRVERLVEVIAATAGDDDGPIHLVGHSTGGLDARLLLAPGARLTDAAPPARYTDRVRSVVSVASPHRGTPLAGLFNNLAGQAMLRALSAVTIHTIRLGHVPLPAALLLARALAPAGRLRRLRRPVLEQVYRLVLRDFSEERRAQLETFFADVGRDRALLAQLTPEAMELFGARSTRRRGVRYASVVTRARPPHRGAVRELGMRPVDQAMYGVFRALYRASATMPETGLPEPNAAQRRALLGAFGDLPGARDNDAIVPTRSQVFGEVIHAAWADHHDVIGHFADPDHEPPHVDWLRTLSSFTRPQFEALWRAVADYALRAD